MSYHGPTRIFAYWNQKGTKRVRFGWDQGTLRCSPLSPSVIYRQALRLKYSESELKRIILWPVLFASLLLVDCSSYEPQTSRDATVYRESGKASFYAKMLQGRTTASGEAFSHSLKTAAHKTLPFGTMVKVTNLKNDKSVVVRVNDRGPYIRGRIIDLSRSAFSSIASVSRGVINVQIEVIE